MKINILEQAVFNRIAAGEVVENPAAVVKELVENSIDAGATQISVSIMQGGIKSIEISDNGCGIQKEELYKAILPHATSKIAVASDLDSISTLGFRGEALASIAAVSQTEIKSKYFEADFGAKLTAKGGEEVIITDAAYNQGTSIIIDNLFYNTPARFKFLKGVKTEEAYVTKAVSQLILANPNIIIKYFVDGKQVYASDGYGQESAIRSIYSSDICNKLLPLIEDTTQSVQVSGFISNPSLYKHNRNLQTLVLNGRIVSDPNVSATVNSAYGNRLMSHNFPVFVINIIIRFDEVDVNVHPNKREVRYANSRQVYGTIFNAVKRTLEAYEREDTCIVDSKSEALAALDNDQTRAYNVKEEVSLAKPSINIPDYQSYQSSPIYKHGSVPYFLDKIEQDKENNGITKVADNAGFPQITDILLQKTSIGDTETAKGEQSFPPKIKERIEDASYKVIGQIFDTYIALEYNGKFMLIDQHAAHEKLLYDKLKAETDAGIAASQSLMVPYIYEDNPVGIAEILALTAEINSFGFEIEPFGNNTLKINAVPSALTDIDPDQFIKNISEGIRSHELAQSDLLKEKLMQKACKSAIKGGYSYSKEQTEKILDYFFQNGMPLQCPHGRPAYITFSKAELEKMFRRKI